MSVSPWLRQTRRMRLLLGGDFGGDFGGELSAGGALDRAQLSAAYAVPPGPWLRTNFVASLDGACAGADGLSGSLNNAADKVIFDLLRSLADVVLVGERTARAESYGVPPPRGGRAPLLAVVSNQGRVPPSCLPTRPERGRVILITCAAAREDHRAEAVAALGAENVWVVGGAHVDLAAAKVALTQGGWPRILCEGGPSLNLALLRANLVDDVAQTIVPRLVGGVGPRIVSGHDLDIALTLTHLLEEDGTLLGLWRVNR